MTSNHEEYSNYIIFKNLKCSVKIYWDCSYLSRKTNEGTSGN